jgi:hypothetical protein
MTKSFNETVIRIGNTDRLLTDWEKHRQIELNKAKQMGLIPYCNCMIRGVPMELFSREGKVYIRKIKNTQHSANCEYGSQQKKVAHMPVNKQAVEMQSWLQTYWEIAKLNTWHQGLIGKRSWTVVRKRITEAVESNNGKSKLAQELFAPEAFNKDRVEEQKKIALQDIDDKLIKFGHFILFGEIKEVVKSKFDAEVKVLHAPYLKLWAHEKYISWIKPEDAEHRQFILAKIKRSDKGNLYVDQLDYLITSMNYLPVQDPIEARIMDSLTKSGAAFTIEFDHGITAVVTKNPAMRFLVLNEATHDKINQANEASSQKGEIVALLNSDNANEVLDIMLRFSNQNTDKSAQINNEEVGFSQ